MDNTVIITVDHSFFNEFIFYFLFFQLSHLAAAQGFVLVWGTMIDVYHQPVVSCTAPQCLTKLFPNTVGTKDKAAFPTRKAFTAVLCSCFMQKVPSTSDKEHPHSSLSQSHLYLGLFAFVTTKPLIYLCLCLLTGLWWASNIATMLKGFEGELFRMDVQNLTGYSARLYSPDCSFMFDSPPGFKILVNIFYRISLGA